MSNPKCALECRKCVENICMILINYRAKAGETSPSSKTQARIELGTTATYDILGRNFVAHLASGNAAFAR